MQLAALLLATAAAAKPFQMSMQHRETETEAGEYPLSELPEPEWAGVGERA